MSEERPFSIIGVIACEREVEGEPAQAVKHRYLEAVRDYAEAVPLILPSNQRASNAAAIAACVDALLLTGSNSNIAPRSYGEDAKGIPPIDEGRDRFSLALIEAFVSAGKPVIGVCRGLQEINVAFGGSLKDMRDDPIARRTHHAPEGMPLERVFSHGHAVTVHNGGPFAEIIRTTFCEVNSVHYQAIDRLGGGLSVAARSDDGCIEAIYSTTTTAPVIAVQWHPEWRPHERQHDHAFWRFVGTAARRARDGTRRPKQ
jgi:putative glutamine amidotransferase